MNILPKRIKPRTKHLFGAGKRVLLYWTLFFYFVLVGCQSTTQEQTVQPATFSPTRNESEVPDLLKTFPAAIATGMTVTPVTPTRDYVTPSSEALITVSSTRTPALDQTLTMPSSTPFIVDGFALYGVNINDEEQVYALQPGDTSRFITIGQMLYGQALSPDGTKIVVDTNDRSQPERSPENIFIYDLEAKELLSLNLLYSPSAVFWSKDSTLLLYIVRYGDESPDQLVLYNVATGENQVLIEMEEIFQTAGWAVDGQTVAFVAKLDGQYDLFTINSVTLEMQQQTNTPDIETMVIWSPTALEILIGTVLDERSAFESWPWGVESLYLLDTVSDDLRLLADKDLSSESVSWSPDGKKLALSDAGLLCFINLGTMAEICPLADVEPLNEYFASFRTRPVWSGNSDWIAFYGINQPCINIFFVVVETNIVIPGDLGCDVTQISSSSPIYWSSTN